MKSKYGFTRFDTIDEFKNWLNNQPKYNYTGIQIHHMWSPNYSNFYKSNGTHEDELTRQYNTKTFHVKTNGWSDIAQHLSIFPNGKIVTGRSFSKTTAIGIKGWNSNKICIEIYGNFDKGHDVMTKEQKEAVIATYALLCKKFGITPSTNTIRCHAWFTAGGTYLGDYNPSRSAKTCPGTNFMGIGNTKTAINNYFIPWVKEYMNSGKCNFTSNDNNTSTTLPTTPSVEYDENVKALQRALNLSYGVGLDEDGLMGFRTESAIKNHYLKAVKANEHARLIQTWFKSLGYNIDIDGSYGNNSANVCKEFQKSKGLTVDGVAGLDTHKALIKALKEDRDNHIYYRVITGSYTERANANEEVEKLKALGYNPFLVAFNKDGKTYLRVVALSTNDRAEADKHVANLKAKGYSAFISVFTK